MLVSMIQRYSKLKWHFKILLDPFYSGWANYSACSHYLLCYKYLMVCCCTHYYMELAAVCSCFMKNHFHKERKNPTLCKLNVETIGIWLQISLLQFIVWEWKSKFDKIIMLSGFCFKDSWPSLLLLLHSESTIIAVRPEINLDNCFQ